MRLLKILVLAAMILALFAAGVWLGAKLSRPVKPAGPHEEPTTAVVEQIQSLSDLVTVKYVVEKVVILDSPPSTAVGEFVQGNNRVLLLAHGIVKAGIDLKQLTAGDVQVQGDTIRIHLPPSRVTDAYLDENRTKVIDWERGFLRNFDKDLEQTARKDAVDDIQRAAREDGILREADDRAKLELSVFLNQAGFAHVQFVGQAPGDVVAPERVPKF